MPYYGFLMHMGNVTLDASVEDALMRITMVGCGLSVMGVMLTIFLVCFLPLRSDSMFIVANIAVSLLCSQTCYLGIENSYPDNTMCRMAAGVLHYFFLCFHFWMLVYGVHLFLKMRLGNRSPNWQRRYMYVLTGWLLPLLIVLICALVNPKGYGMEHICWLSHINGSHWAFVAPVLFIMACYCRQPAAVKIIHGRDKNESGFTP
ncbi:adhesion G-protein coupled receptor D1-like [Liolophura sinensis]|uniref:adhesion G-protein coupled receptor D1-like n=1 Tax=Liolophura sinensis TaxID=3198878 RepID=UPI003158B5E6